MATLYDIELPNQDPCFSFDTVLDGATYYFRMRFNTRVNLWYMDVKDKNYNQILNGIPCYSDRYLFSFMSNQDLPKGFMIFLHADSTVDADRFSLGLDVKLLYNEDD